MPRRPRIIEIPGLYSQLVNKDLGDTRVGSNNPVEWCCIEFNDHVWITSPNNRIQKYSSLSNEELNDIEFKCIYCSGRRVKVGFNDMNTTAPELVLDFDYSSNKFSPEEVVAGCGKKVHWECHKCGYKWVATGWSRFGLGAGCQKCSYKSVIKKPKPGQSLGSLYPELVKEWSKLNDNDIYSVFPKSGRKYWFKCLVGHDDYSAVVHNRTRVQSGCPVCAYGSQSSKIEDMFKYRIGLFFNVRNTGSGVPYIIPGSFNEDRNVRTTADIVFNYGSNNFVVEYDGSRWHTDELSVERDIRKTKYLISQGFKVIRVRGSSKRYKTNYLDISDNNLLQVPHTEYLGIDSADNAVNTIIDWVMKFD